MPGTAMDDRVNRTASAPYWSISCSGSMMLPSRFAHFFAAGVPDNSVDVHLAEWNVSCKLEPHHDHARHPEENNVRAR